MLISVDVGYGMVKAVSEAGNRISFPSVVAPKTSGLPLDILGAGIVQNDYSLTFKDPSSGEEGEYMVGDAALGVGGIRAWEKDFSANRYFKIMVALACSLLQGNRSSSEVDLVVGLPLAFYTSEYRDNLMKNMVDAELSLKLDNNEKTNKISIKSLKVNPQAVGVFYDSILTENGDIKDRELANKPSGVIDMGYRTTEVVAMGRGKGGLVARDDMATGFEIGVNKAHSLIKSEFDAAEGSNIPLEWIEQAMLWSNGMLDYRGDQYNLKPLAKKVYSEIADQVIAGVKQTWGQELDRLAIIQVAGGGGEAIYPFLKEELPNVRLAGDPYFANAMGFLIAALYQRSQMGETAGEEPSREEAGEEKGTKGKAEEKQETAKKKETRQVSRKVQGDREEVKGYRSVEKPGEVEQGPAAGEEESKDE